MSDNVLNPYQSNGGFRAPVDERVAHLRRDLARLRSTQLEHALDHRDLRARRVKAAERHPIVGHETCTDDVTASVDAAGLLR